MGKFTIQPHGRLQEWIAHEKGYFRDEGLDYEFARGPSSDTKKNVDARGKVTELLSGAFESYKSCRRQQERKVRYLMRVPLGGEPGLRSSSSQRTTPSLRGALDCSRHLMVWLGTRRDMQCDNFAGSP
jgi:hypothetical protein